MMTSSNFRTLFSFVLVATLMVSSTALAQSKSRNQTQNDQESTAQSPPRQTVNPQDNLLPSVGPVKKVEAPKETIENFDFTQFEKFDFRQIMTRLRDNGAQINKLYGSMPVGFPALQQEQMNTIRLLKEQNGRLTQLMPRAAVEEYKKAPGQDQTVTNIVYAALQNLLDGRSDTFGFDPVMAMEISELLIKNGDEQSGVYFQAFRAAYALHDFERAEQMWNKAKEKGLKDEKGLFENKIQETKNKWARELKFRNKDKTLNLPRVQVETTEGTFIAELFETEAPGTVGNFISLAEKGFFDGHSFHLVRPGMFAQTGDPLGNGTGGPDYNIACECFGDNARDHFSGTLSMATSGRDTGGSQFFVTHQPNSIFDGKYTAFGRVIDGMNVIYRLNKVDKTGLNPDEAEPSKIIKVTVLRKRTHDYKPNKVSSDNPTDPEIGQTSPIDSGR